MDDTERPRASKAYGSTSMTDEYMMYSFKVKPCPRLDHHNWKHCPHRHPGEVAAQRRHPSLHKPAFCMNLKLYGSCAAGDDCPFSHNTFEMSLHPERYKTTLCTLGDKCNRDICFFAHSTEDLRTPDVTAPLGALGQEASAISLAQMTGAEGVGNASDAAAGPGAGGDTLTAVGMDGLPLLSQMQQLGAQPQQQQQQQQQPPQQQGDLHHLLLQVEQQLQLEAPGAQQQLSQREQQVLLLAQAQQQQQQQHQQQQQQMNDLVLAQQQLMLANAAGGMGGVISNNQAVSAGLPGQAMLSNSFTAGGMQRGGAVAGVQQQLVPILLQDAAGHRGESFTSQCSTSSFVSGIGALRAAGGSLPVSPLIDRSAHSFTITDRSTTGSFSTLGSVPERPHSFSVGDRPQVAALLANLGERPQSFTNLGERPQSFTLMDASRPNSFTIGQRSQASMTVERSSASFSVLEHPAAGLSMMDGGLSVVERSSDMQQSFTLGQRPQLQQGAPWYEREAATGVLAGGQADGNGAVYQLVAAQDAQQPQQQQQQLQGNGRFGLNALWQWR